MGLVKKSISTSVLFAASVSAACPVSDEITNLSRVVSVDKLVRTAKLAEIGYVEQTPSTSRLPGKEHRILVATQQGHQLKWLIKTLGKKVSRFIGFNDLGDGVFTIPSAKDLNRAAQALHANPPWVRPVSQFHEVEAHGDAIQLYRSFAFEATIPVPSPRSGSISVADYLAYASALFVPRPFVVQLRRQLQFPLMVRELFLRHAPHAVALDGKLVVQHIEEYMGFLQQGLERTFVSIFGALVEPAADRVGLEAHLFGRIPSGESPYDAFLQAMGHQPEKGRPGQLGQKNFDRIAEWVEERGSWEEPFLYEPVEQRKFIKYWVQHLLESFAREHDQAVKYNSTR